MHMTLQNPKHEAFAVTFVKSGNAAEAARVIGYSSHAAQRGSDLLRRPDVQARVEELMRNRPSLPTRLARRLDAVTLHRAAEAVAFLSSLVA
jgi:phage terminase small subunit